MLTIKPRQCSLTWPTYSDLGRARAIVFDIETRPQPVDRLRETADPFVPPEPPSEFDPASVKVGNLKAEKAAEKIEAARAAHQVARDAYGVVVETARGEWERQLTAKAALSPLTGEVCAIGMTLVERSDRSLRHFCCSVSSDDEMVLLDRWWQTVSRWKLAMPKDDPIVGFNCFGFDLPFLLRRAWILGIEPTAKPERNYWGSPFVDLMQIWQAGNRGEQFAKLGTVARVLGCGQKNGDGAMFGELLETDPEQAIAYLTNDLEMMARVAEKLGVF